MTPFQKWLLQDVATLTTLNHHLHSMLVGIANGRASIYHIASCPIRLIYQRQPLNKLFRLRWRHGVTIHL